jgi:hypothetical protein
LSDAFVPGSAGLRVRERILTRATAWLCASAPTLWRPGELAAEASLAGGLVLSPAGATLRSERDGDVERRSAPHHRTQGIPCRDLFPFPVTGGGEEAFFFTEEEVLEQEFGTSGCKWKQEDVTPKPESTTPGTLCVFEQYGDGKISFDLFQTPGEIFGLGYSPSGTYLIFLKASTATAISRQIVGTWAVTAK